MPVSTKNETCDGSALPFRERFDNRIHHLSDVLYQLRRRLRKCVAKASPSLAANSADWYIINPRIDISHATPKFFSGAVETLRRIVPVDNV